MVRGKIIFRCPKCGKLFISLDIEYGATVYSHPMPCPRCGTLSAPLFKRRLYEWLGITKKEENVK